jgi:response regulator RpfG family c-di-GMP phosphodiesterase
VTKLSIKLLVFDQSKQTESMAKETLSPRGFDVITASSMALAVFLARKNFPSVIVSGKDDDLAFLSEIKSDPDLEQIPFVLVLTTDDPQTQQKALQLGASKILTQPLSAAKFIAELSPYLVELKDDRPEETSE